MRRIRVPVGFRIDGASAVARRATGRQAHGPCSFVHPLPRAAFKRRPIPCGACPPRGLGALGGVRHPRAVSVPACRAAGVVNRMPRCTCSCVYQCLPVTPPARAASRRATGVVGYEGPYGNVRTSDAETGWSLRPDGRLNDGTLPRRGMGASRVAPFRAPPVSACTDPGCGSMPASRHIVSRNRAACALASSAWTSAPTALREKTSTHRDTYKYCPRI